MNEKLCPKCGNPNGRTNTNSGSYCKKCHSINQSAHSKRTGYKGPKARNRIHRRLVITGKDKPCADCCVQYPWYVMDYDHVRGEKLFNISQGSKFSKERILAEIAKCDVVCANCHRERTQKRLVS